ncbi:MAG: hypothetical protein V1859_00990 [archaeon]
MRYFYNKHRIFELFNYRSLLFLGIGAFLFFVNKQVFSLVLFSSLDITQKIFEKTLHFELPFDFIVIGVIAFSYFNFNLLYIGYFILFMLLSRIFFGNIESRHIVKAIVLFMTGLFIALLGKNSFGIVAICAYTFRILADYLLSYFLIQEIDYKRIPSRICQIILLYVILETGLIQLLF